MVAVASSRAVAPQVAPLPRWRLRVWLGATIAAFLTTLGFLGFGAYNLARDRSLDLPGTGLVRLGFYGNRWFSVWTCSEGHRHLSAPYWVGFLSLLLLSTSLARAWATRRARTPRTAR